MSEFFRQQLSIGTISHRVAVVALERMVEDLRAHAEQKRGPKRFTPAQIEESRLRVLEEWTWEE